MTTAERKAGNELAKALSGVMSIDFGPFDAARMWPAEFERAEAALKAWERAKRGNE